MKWRKELANVYKVSIAYDKLGRAKVTVPKPLLDVFDRPNALTFKLQQEGTITVEFTKSPNATQ